MMKTLVKPYQDLQLYHFDTCPYCVKTRQIINNLNINLTMKNIRKNPKQGIELKKGGGKIQVPCLRIEDAKGTIQWLYESNDIINFLTP